VLWSKLLRSRALSRDVTACIFDLCNRSPSRWKRNGQVDVQMRPLPTKDEMSLDEILRTYSGAVQQAAGGGPSCTP
jgi:hypothetical protein